MKDLKGTKSEYKSSLGLDLVKGTKRSALTSLFVLSALGVQGLPKVNALETSQMS
jgi:hypothetical protein